MTNERLTGAVATLLLKREAMAKFRDSPEDIGDEFGLTEAELSALKSGDEVKLLELGLDSTVLAPKVQSLSWWPSTFLRATSKMVAPAVVSLVLMGAIAGGTASATENLAPQVRALGRVRARASIRTLQLGVVERAAARTSARLVIAPRTALVRARALTGSIDAHVDGLSNARASIPGGVSEPPCDPCVEK